MMDPGVALQWDIFAAMTPEKRVAIGMAWSDLGFALRRDRLRRTFPLADVVGLRWALVREVLGYPISMEPIT